MIYRKRYIPDENIPLINDEILHQDQNLLITRWKCLKPRDDFASGLSAYYINRNFKISKFLKTDGSLHYYYCDIIKTISADNGDLVFCDLLIDLIVHTDESVEVLDLPDLRKAYDGGLISADDVFMAIEALDELMRTIRDGEFKDLIAALS